MTKWMLAAGAAALAVAAPSTAERGGGKGGGQGHSAQPQKAERSGGKARAQRGGGDRQARAQQSHQGGRGRAAQFAQNDNRGGNKGRADNRSNDRGRNQTRAENRQGDNHQGNQNRGHAAFEDRQGKGARAIRIDNGQRHGRGDVRIADFDNDRIVRVRDVNRGVVRFRDVDRDDLFVRGLGFGVGGCPPGLAKKAVACMPPGQAARLVGQPLISARGLGALGAVPLSVRGLYGDNDDYYYRYGGGYVYRVDRDNDFISSMIPLFGAALVGQPLSPNYYQNSFVPSYYNSFYPNSPYDCHQYGYGYVYETDCVTGLVENVIPTYDNGYGVGQIMPASYSYYNLPYAYRSSFVDNDDYYYRYAPGAIYQVDRGTALVSSVAALLTNGMTVGQPMPLGYSTYNVPMAYRSTYYDTPNALYRYDNGYIYNVDPVTQLVRAIAYAIV